MTNRGLIASLEEWPAFRSSCIFETVLSLSVGRLSRRQMDTDRWTIWLQMRLHIPSTQLLTPSMDQDMTSVISRSSVCPSMIATMTNPYCLTTH